MTVVRASLHALALPLVAPLATAHGTVEQRRGFLVRLFDDAGACGVGEALPLPSFGGETFEACEAALGELLRECAEGCDADAVLREADAAPVAASALRNALDDLAARRAGVPLARALGASLPAGAAVGVNALVTGDDPDAIARFAERASAEGFTTCKLKVAAGSLADDLARIDALRIELARRDPRANVRLDANGGWPFDEAREAIAALASVPGEGRAAVEWLEQPLAPGDPDAFAKLREATGAALRFAADESANDPRERAALLEAGVIDAVVLKLPLCGGARGAVELARSVRSSSARPIAVCVSSFLDSSLGIATGAHAAAAIDAAGGAPVAHGLATARLLSRDVGAELEPKGGQLALPADGAGTGYAVAEFAKPLAEFARGSG